MHPYWRKSRYSGCLLSYKGLSVPQKWRRGPFSRLSVAEFRCHWSNCNPSLLSSVAIGAAAILAY